MMTAIIQKYLISIFLGILSGIGILGVILFYLLKVKKISAKEEVIDYERFDRRNILDYLKFDDLISDAAGEAHEMGVVCRGNIYTAGIDIKGFHFSSASSEEQLSTMLKSIAFTNIINEPIQMRQSVSAIQLSDNIEEHEEFIRQYDRELITLDEEYRTTMRAAEDYLDEPDVYDTFREKLDYLERTIRATRWLSDEAEVNVAYMKELVSRTQDSEKKNQIMFSYIYNPNDFTETPDEEEIKIRAIQELRVRAASYARALERCGCRCKPLSASAITEALYNHMYPLHPGTERFQDLLDNEIHRLYVTSESIYQLRRQQIGEEKFAELMQMYRKEYDEKVKLGDIELTRLIRKEYEAFTERES